MCESRRVGDDCIGCEGLSGFFIGFTTCSPTSVYHLQPSQRKNHLRRLDLRTSLSIFRLRPMSPLTTDAKPGIRPGSAISVGGTSVHETWTAARLTFHHVAHKFFRVSSNIEKLKSVLLDERAESLMRSDAYAVLVLNEFLAECNEWLNIPYIVLVFAC